MLRFYVDDSNKHGSSKYVLAGALADASRWADFTREWQSYLDFLKIRYFKMAEASTAGGEFAGNRERADEAIKLLNPVILNHAEHVFSVVMDKNEFHEVFPDNNPYRPSTFMLFVFADGVAENINQKRNGETIEFIFDRMTDQNAIAEKWANFKIVWERKGWKVSRFPKFEDDKDVLPLQAADMIAWWECQRIEEEFDFSKGRKPIPKVPSENRSLPGNRFYIDREFMEKQKNAWFD